MMMVREPSEKNGCWALVPRRLNRVIGPSWYNCCKKARLGFLTCKQHSKHEEEAQLHKKEKLLRSKNEVSSE